MLADKDAILKKLHTHILICFSFITLLGCVSVPGLVLRDAPRRFILPSGKSFNLRHSEGLRGRRWWWQLEIDHVTQKLWSAGTYENNIFLYEIDVNRGNIIQEINLHTGNEFYPVIEIFNNHVVLVSRVNRGHYLIINIETNERFSLYIERVNGVFPFNNPYLTGFNGQSLIFDTGYYDIENQVYHYFELPLKYPRIQRDIRIGLNEDNYIVYHNIYSQDIINTERKRRTSPFFNYSGLALYFIDLENNSLYYSRDIYNLMSIIQATSPLGGPAWCSKVWYSINLHNRIKKRINIFSLNALIYDKFD